MTPRALLAAAALTAAFSLAPAPLAAAAPPSDAQFDQVLKDFETAWTAATTRDEITAAAEKATAGLKLEDLTAVQIGRMLSFQGLIDPIATPDDAWDRLETFLPDRGVDGATAAVHTMGRRLRAAEASDAKLGIIRAALTHPGLEEAIASGGVPHFFARIRMSGDLAREAAPEIAALDRLLTPALAPHLATTLTPYYELSQAALADDKETLEALRIKLVAYARTPVDGLSERQAQSRADAAAYLDGAFARGTLIDGPAPAVEIIWSSDPKVTSLAALEGRVVIVDFWATWCGPCVASIPKIRELAARYEGYPVTIIGATSIQGNHYPGDGKPVDTKGNPEKEFALMAEYIPQKNITWPIVFTKESCFNGAYGVRGIPHVTMIDPAGNVRHNSLRPSAPLAEKSAMIDALLKEFNLPTPEPVPGS